MKKRAAKKTVASKTKKRPAHKVKKVILPPAHVLHVAVAKDHVPVIATDHEAGIVKIVPVPVAKVRGKTWHEWFFGY